MLLPFARRRDLAILFRIPALLLALGTCPLRAYVFLDTSVPDSASDSAAKPAGALPASQASGAKASSQAAAQPKASRQHDASAPANVSAPTAAAQTPGAAKDSAAPAHVGTVLFLSADSKMVYAYVGFLKALEQYGLQPDAVVAESKAALVGAAWALGYKAGEMENRFLDPPLEYFLRPYPAERESAPVRPSGPDPLQWEIPIGLQSLQSPGAQWSDVTLGGNDEYLHLSWMIARLTHDGPAGPVEELSAAPRRLAVQVSDLNTNEEAVATQGSLQNILKGSLLPADAIRKRRNLWPYASGSLLSGHAVMRGHLPFACDRIIVLEPGHRLRAPPLESGPQAWTDSLTVHARQNAADAGIRDGTRIIRIAIEPTGEFEPSEPDSRMWIDLGYTSALRSMDLLQATLGQRGPVAARRDSVDGPLGLNRLTVNPLASGGRQLLLDLIRSSDREDDSAGDKAVATLIRSGNYSDLDVEWTKSPGDERASLVFDAKEKSDVRFRAGWNATFTGEQVPDRPPELYAGWSWSEPFYIPFQGEVDGLLGGHRPGYDLRIQIAPVYPLHLELGLTRTYWDINYPTPIKAAAAWDALPFRMNRTLSEVFLKLFPFPNAYFRTAIQKHEMDQPQTEDEGDEGFLSTDFEETGFVGAGRRGSDGLYPFALKLRYRNLNRVNLYDFLYDLVQAGRIEAFSFEDEYFMAFLSSANFQDAKIEYRPVFGKAALYLTAGAFRQYAPALYPTQSEHPMHGHWEAQAAYATTLGVVRVGMAAIDQHPPFYFLRIGADLKLGFDHDD